MFEGCSKPFNLSNPFNLFQSAQSLSNRSISVNPFSPLKVKLCGGKVLMDELVVPHEPITDHNTQYSGITAAMLEGVTLTLPQARTQMMRFLGPQTILVRFEPTLDVSAMTV